MARRNRRTHRRSQTAAEGPDQAQLQSFYQGADALVEQQLDAAFEHELRAAVHLVVSVEGDRWSW
jgi:hypothetical protein